MEGRAHLGKRLTGASGLSAKVDALVGALLCLSNSAPKPILELLSPSLPPSGLWSWKVSLWVQRLSRPLSV